MYVLIVETRSTRVAFSHRLSLFLPRTHEARLTPFDDVAISPSQYLMLFGDDDMSAALVMPERRRRS